MINKLKKKKNTKWFIVWKPWTDGDPGSRPQHRKHIVYINSKLKFKFILIYRKRSCSSHKPVSVAIAQLMVYPSWGVVTCLYSKVQFSTTWNKLNNYRSLVNVEVGDAASVEAGIDFEQPLGNIRVLAYQARQDFVELLQGVDVKLAGRCCDSGSSEDATRTRFAAVQMAYLWKRTGHLKVTLTGCYSGSTRDMPPCSQPLP